MNRKVMERSIILKEKTIPLLVFLGRLKLGYYAFIRCSSASFMA